MTDEPWTAAKIMAVYRLSGQQRFYTNDIIVEAGVADSEETYRIIDRYMGDITIELSG